MRCSVSRRSWRMMRAGRKVCVVVGACALMWGCAREERIISERGVFDGLPDVERGGRKVPVEGRDLGKNLLESIPDSELIKRDDRGRATVRASSPRQAIVLTRSLLASAMKQEALELAAKGQGSEGGGTDLESTQGTTDLSLADTGASVKGVATTARVGVGVAEFSPMEVFVDQVLAERTVRELSSEGQTREGMKGLFLRDGADIIGLIDLMPAGELSPNARMQRVEADLWRIDLVGKSREIGRFTTIWIAREKGSFRFLWAS
jgi:hypothetical protein